MTEQAYWTLIVPRIAEDGIKFHSYAGGALGIPVLKPREERFKIFCPVHKRHELSSGKKIYYCDICKKYYREDKVLKYAVVGDKLIKATRLAGMFPKTDTYTVISYVYADELPLLDNTVSYYLMPFDDEANMEKVRKFKSKLERDNCFAYTSAGRMKSGVIEESSFVIGVDEEKDVLIATKVIEKEKIRVPPVESKIPVLAK